MTDNTQAGGEGASPRRGAWRAQIVVPVAVAVLGALLVTALTPLGDRLREVVFPTRATVTGAVTLSGAPLAGATVELDERDAVTTRSNGEFTLEDVGAGDHRVRVEASAVQPLDTDFVVPRGADDHALETLAVEPTYRLGYYVAIVPGDRPSDPVSYDISVWVDAAQADLERIASASYSLPPPLPQEPVTGGSLAQAFCYRQLGSVPFDDLIVIGTPSSVTARIELDGMPPVDLTWSGETVTPPPADCLTVQME